MKANELRIGNYVYLSDKNKVWQILDGHEIDECDNNPFSEPIHLTEEWLVNFGFEKHGIEWWGKGFCLEVYKDKLYYSGGEGLHIVIDLKYVHQIQNLYFALTGKELEISI